MTNLQLAIHFFFQIGAILLVCQIVGLVGRRAGQPQVVSEMLAGVLLGPSLLGLFLPAVSAKLFPPETLRVLFPVSQLGLAAYMFVVGLEFRVDIVQRQMRSAVAVSIAGMAAPFVLGAALGWYFHGHTSLFPAKTSLVEAMIFLGASMCITAFPMLARILHFKRLTGTTMGTVAIGAGAINDAAAWGLLAIVLASFDGNFAGAAWNIGGGVGFVAVVLLVARPLLAQWARQWHWRAWGRQRAGEARAWRQGEGKKWPGGEWERQQHCLTCLHCQVQWQCHCGVKAWRWRCRLQHPRPNWG